MTIAKTIYSANNAHWSMIVFVALIYWAENFAQYDIPLKLFLWYYVRYDFLEILMFYMINN